MSKIHITKIYASDILVAKPDKYNVCNLYGDEQPSDYSEKLNLSNTSQWVDKFHKNYHKITLDESDVSWMWRAFELTLMTGKFSHLYDDDLEDTCKKYVIPVGRWFIRTERVSLKYGKYGKGPYDNLRNIIISIITTEEDHSVLKRGDTECNIYFLPWIDMDIDKEFRIFVHSDKITAISQQRWYQVNKWLSKLTDEQIRTYCNKILQYFEMVVCEKMAYMRDYTMDLALVGESETPYFIEPNGFGKNYSAGSALFHWINDEHELYDSNSIELRYVVE